MNADDDKVERLASIVSDQIRTVRTLEETVEKLLPILARSANGSSTNRTTVTQTDRTPMWVCVVIVVALAVALMGRSDDGRTVDLRQEAQLNDIRNDIRELRGVDQELRSTDNAVRAYINTGILKPKNEASKGVQK